MRPGEGITGSAAAARAPVMLESQAHLDPRFKNFPNLPEDEYESILAVPILTRDGTLEGALNVRTREPRAFGEDEVELLLAIAAQVAQSIEHAKLYAEAQRRVHELEALARISEAVSNSLYLEESLEAIVKTTMDALAATGAALVLDDGRIAWPEGTRGAARDAPAAALARPADRRARRRPRDAVHRRRPRAARVDRDARRRRARARARGHARRARARDPPPREEQPADGRVAPAAAGALHRRDRPARGARALGQPHPRDRRGARGADRAARRGRRPRGSDRPAAGDARAGRRRRQGGDGRARCRCRSPARARPRWRSSSRSCCRTRSSTAADRCASSSRGATATSCSRSPTTATGSAASRAPGTGLSIVRALVRDELRGTLDLRSDGGTRAEVVFPRLGDQRLLDAPARPVGGTTSSAGGSAGRRGGRAAPPRAPAGRARARAASRRAARRAAPRSAAPRRARRAPAPTTCGGACPPGRRRARAGATLRGVVAARASARTRGAAACP